MRIQAIAKKLLKQLLNDKRTVALVIVAPLVILTLISFVLNGDNAEYKIGIINENEDFITELGEFDDEQDINVVTEYMEKDEAVEAIKNRKIIAAVEVSDDYKNSTIYIDGTNSADSNKINVVVKRSIIECMRNDMKAEADSISEDIEEIKDDIESMSRMGPMGDIDTDAIDMDNIDFEEPVFNTEYIYGNEDMSLFDNYGSSLIGVIIFFFAYLLAGINFLSERTSGTLERVLSTPIKRHEVILGYVLGFSVLAVVQTLVVTLFTIYVLGITIVGNVGLVFIINLLTAMCALTLGILMSNLAKTEFQMIQFIPLVILPQIFLCGMFKLTGVWEKIGYIIPLHYTVDALQRVMLNGFGITEIAVDLIVLLLISVLFIILNTVILKKERKI